MKIRAALESLLERHALPLHAGLFLAALLVRLLPLESGPLSPAEAAQAWGALNLVRGGAASSASALFASLTAGLLFLAGPSHWAPRLLPAVAGSLVVFLPLLLPRERGRIEAFLLALLLALSPSLWIASTMAGGTTPGFLTGGFCILYLRRKDRQPLPAGIAIGLAAASGPVGWSGLAIAAMVPIADRILNPPVQIQSSASGSEPFGKFFLNPILLAGAAVGLAAGSTGLFLFPRGLGALAAGVTDWMGAFFSGWPRVGEFILWMVGYESLALVFGAVGIVLLRRGTLNDEDRFWGTFVAVSAVWILVRPAAFPDETLWILLPLLVLGARALRRGLDSPFLEERPAAVLLQAGVVIVLAAFGVFNLAAYAATGLWTHLILAIIGFLGGLLPGLLFTQNWMRDLNLSLTGLALAWAVILSVTQAGAGWNGAVTRRNSANELWQNEAAAADVIRLHGTLEQLSEWQTGTQDELAVLIQLPEQSALGWELLTYRSTEYTVEVDMLAKPAVLIAPYVEVEDAVAVPKLTAAYRGQAFGYTERRAWSGWPGDFIRWLLFRQGPVERTRVILWAREGVLIPEAGLAP
jgi:hypothetical protein